MTSCWVIWMITDCLTTVNMASAIPVYRNHRWATAIDGKGEGLTVSLDMASECDRGRS